MAQVHPSGVAAITDLPGESGATPAALSAASLAALPESSPATYHAAEGAGPRVIMLTWWEALWFSGGLCCYGLMGIAGALAYWTGRAAMTFAGLSSESNVYRSWSDEALMSYPVPLCVPDWNVAGVRFQTFVSDSLFGPMILLSGFFHMSTFCYLVPTRLRAITVVTYILTHAFCLVLYVVVNVQVVFWFMPAIQVFVLAFVVKVALPDGELVSNELARCAIVAGIGSIYTMVAHLIPNSDAGSYFRFLVVFPLIREVSRYMMLRTGWRLSFSASPAGEGVPVNRELGTMFFAWCFIFNALLVRMQFTNLSSHATAGSILVMQAVQEIGMRVTMERRDRWLRSASFASFWTSPQAVPTRQGTVVALVDPYSNGRTRLSRVLSVLKREQIEQAQGLGGEALPVMSAQQGHANASRFQFYSFVIAVEMAAEYAAIFCCATNIILGARRPLINQYLYYTTGGSWFLDMRSIIGPIAAWTASQLLAELIVDSACAYYESRMQLDVRGAWADRFPRFGAVFVVSTAFAIVIIEKLVVNLDSFGHCYGQDFCWCLGNGLVPGGVVEWYCKVLYANSSGLPPDNSTACKV